MNGNPNTQSFRCTFRDLRGAGQFPRCETARTTKLPILAIVARWKNCWNLPCYSKLELLPSAFPSFLLSFRNNALMSGMAYCHFLGLRERNGLYSCSHLKNQKFTSKPSPPDPTPTHPIFSAHFQTPTKPESNLQLWLHTTWWTHHKQLGKVHCQIQSEDESKLVSHSGVLYKTIYFHLGFK